MLQWGHDFSAVEIVQNLGNSDLCQNVLQWGHDFSAVEILTYIDLAAQIAVSFNGATTFQPWK